MTLQEHLRAACPGTDSCGCVWRKAADELDRQAAEIAALRKDAGDVRKALLHLLTFCDADSDGETAFERAVKAARRIARKSEKAAQGEQA